MDHYNPLGDNSDQLCKLCIGKIPGERCTNADPYAGYEGAFRCLLEAGEIAFLVHTTVAEMTSTTFDLSTNIFDQLIFRARDFLFFQINEPMKHAANIISQIP